MRGKKCVPGDVVELEGRQVQIAGGLLMRLNRLAVTDYRNLSAAVLEPAPQLTVLCGANGQGKTNLLEAVWLLTGGKSFRGAKDAELIRRGADFAVLEAAFEAGDRPQEIRLTVGAKGTQRPAGRYV